MVTAVATAAVLVPPPVVPGEQLVERGEQVVITARARLQDRQPGRRVRDPHVQQTVCGVRLGQEALGLLGQIVDHRRTARADLDLLGVHALTVVPPSMWYRK